MRDSAPGLGESQVGILERVKRVGRIGIPELASDLGLSVETVRAHVKSLGRDGLIESRGARKVGRGRPEGLYGLTPAGEALFPNQEGLLLRRLVEFLEERGHTDLVRDFFDDQVERRRARAFARLEGLEGDQRLEEVAKILTEDGFMAETVEEDGEKRLKLCHCPVRNVVNATKAPCRSELGFVRELLGERLARVGYIPEGDHSCCYALTER